MSSENHTPVYLHQTPRWLLLGTLVLLWLLTMPGFFYRGDNFVARASTINLVLEGNDGIPEVQQHQLADLVEEQDKFFVLNDRDHRLYPKYGTYFTLVYLPPVLAELAYRGKLVLLQRTPSLLLIINLYNLLFCLLTVVLLERLARLYTRSSTIVAVFLVLSLWTTYLWYYLRSPTLEVYHLPLFLGWMLCALHYLRGGNGRLLLVAGCLVAVLVQAKSFFVLLLPPLWLLPLLGGPGVAALDGQELRGKSGLGRLLLRLVSLRRQYLRYLVPVSVATIALMLVVNAWKFGAVLETGYTDKIPWSELFSPRFIPHQAVSYLLHPGNYNVFLHYPLLLLALPVLGRFRRRFPADARFLLLVVTLYFLGICCYNDFGEYCYGPRLLLHVVIVGSLPALLLLEGWGQRLRQRSALAVVAVLPVVVILGFSLLLQVWVCSLDYFVFQDSWKLLQPLQVQEIDHYYEANLHRGLICRDLLRHGSRRQQFPPLRYLEQHAAAGRSLVAQYTPIIDRMTRKNLFLWQGPDRTSARK